MVSAAANAITEGETKGLVWRFQAKSTQWGPAGAKVMHSLGLKKVALLAQQNAFVVAMIEPFKAEMAKLGGAVTQTVVYNPDQPSYRAEVEKIFGPEPEGVFCLSLLTDFASIAKPIGEWRYDQRGEESVAYDLENYLVRMGRTAATHSIAELRRVTGQDPFAESGPLGYERLQPAFLDHRIVADQVRLDEAVEHRDQRRPFRV